MPNQEDPILVAPTYQEPELKPISVALHAQEIGKLYADRTSPTAFAQYLLQQFKAAGAPVDGQVHLRLAHGKIYKMKAHPWGRSWIGYMWLPEEMVRRLGAWRTANGVAGSGDAALAEGALVN